VQERRPTTNIREISLTDRVVDGAPIANARDGSSGLAGPVGHGLTVVTHPASPLHLDGSKDVAMAMDDLPLALLAAVDLRGTQGHLLVLALNVL
jgi:hypothetical protein